MILVPFSLLKENIDSGTAEGITYAIELLDVFLSEQLKEAGHSYLR